VGETHPQILSGTQNKDQITRTPASQTFKQGSAGMAMNETFDQIAQKGLVDILVVIDNSGSMSEEQNNLSTKMNELLVSLGNTNWQIGVITTSPVIENNAAKCVMTLIRSSESNAADKFRTAVMAGLNGDGNEQGIRQAVVGLSCPQMPWVRPTSTVATLIVSDEDNCSGGNGCLKLPWENETHLIQYVEGTLGRVIGKNAGFYGIFSHPNQPCNTAANLGRQYARLTDYKANGAKNWGDICDASYKSTLNRISDNIALLLTNQFELKETPSAGTLSLKILLNGGTEQVVPVADFTLTGKSIKFAAGKEPPVGSKILASYRIGVTTMFNSVTLNNDPAAGTLAVKVNGANLPATAYTVTGRTIGFVTQPPSLADIMVDYRLNMALIDRFVLTQAPLPNTLTVRVNGQATSNFTYNPSTRQVIFATPPTDGAKLEFRLQYREGPQLAYRLPLMTGGKNYKVFDGQRELSFTQAGDLFTISTGDHAAGKTLQLRYEVPDGSTKTFPLTYTPIPNSADILVAAGNCDLGMGFEVQGAQLITNCPVGARTEFTLTYKYRDTVRTFTLRDIANPELGRWDVFVDGEPTTEFVRSGAMITLNSDPQLDSKVVILYTLPE
jgi:hypothetical protein